MASLAWGGHANGKIPASFMKKVSNLYPLPGEPVGVNGAYLMAEAADQWELMCRDAKAATGVGPTASECYRDYPSQQGRYATYQRLKKPLAAYPGTSNHGWGRSVDVGYAARAWITANGPKYGFYPTVAGEPWHFDYLGNPSIKAAAQAAKAPQEEEMTARLYRNDKTGTIAGIDPTTGWFWACPNMDYVRLLQALGVVVNAEPINIPPEQFDFLQGRVTEQRQALAGAVWTNGISGYNGVASAAARLAGIDEKADTVNAANIAKIVAALPQVSGGAAGAVDVNKLAAALAPLVTKAVSDEIAKRMQA